MKVSSTAQPTYCQHERKIFPETVSSSLGSVEQSRESETFAKNWTSSLHVQQSLADHKRFSIELTIKSINGFKVYIHL